MIPKRLRFPDVRDDDVIEMKLEREAELEKAEEAIEVRIQRSEKEIEEKRREQMNIKIDIEQWIQEHKRAEHLLQKYTSSYQLKARLNELDDTLRRNRQVRDELTLKYAQYERELGMLEHNQIESPRQKQAIRHLENQHIKAYPLQYFVKLMDDQSPKKESMLDPIKYTVFYEGDTCQPINDLYHVSLKKVIPKRLLTSLPQYGLTMRSDLSPNEQNHAARVLWWIEQIMSGKSSYIKEGIIQDAYGIRGPQEQGTFILSGQAIRRRRNKVVAMLKKRAVELEQLIEQIQEQSDRYSLWSADVHKVEEAESLVSKRVDQRYRLEQLEKINAELMTLQTIKKDNEIAWQETWKQLCELQRGMD